MQAACEYGDMFQLLEGGCGGARAAADALHALYGAVREPWLTRALLAYHARTASARALELLARAPDAHARHLLDALHDQLRAERAARQHALAALAPLVARRPPWLRLLPQHPLARDLLRAARLEREPLPLLHALLALAALVPAAPALAAAHAAELAEALVRAGSGAGGGAGDAHVALAARALFRAVYATHPCTALEALRGAELGAGAAREAWERGVAALAAGVRLHPALVTGSRAQEAEAARWARSEPHDVLAECRRLSLPPAPEPQPPPPEPAPAPLVWRHSPAPPPGSTAQQAALACGALRPGGEGWFALGERSGAESAPHTPLPADDAAEPEPEPAVEATPENTPRLAFRYPEGARPAGGGGGGGGVAARLARVQAERRAADSPVPFGGAPPAAAARPEPRAPAAPEPEPEDREVRELTARAPPPPDWLEAEPPPPRAPDPRRAGPPPRARAPAPRPGAPARRALSAGPGAGAARRDAAAQTVDAWPEPYEFLIADFYRTLPDDTTDQSMESSEPCERLDAYLAELYSGRGGAAAAATATATAPAAATATATAAELAEQLALAHAQLMYERWRREAHAERNRRLLGRCRQVRALELSNAALRDRVRALASERDALRAAAPPPPPPPLPPPAPDAAAALEAALRDERAARLRAEALRSEAEAQRASDAAELQRERGDSFEAARHVEALARAAAAAERRAEHVRRLRRELLVLAEREARLGAAAAEAAPASPASPAPAPAAAAAAERALRAALARAEADAEAAGARAEAAAARAHELEAALAARDAAVAELKRATRLAAEEGAARLLALRDKYRGLLAVVRAGEGRALERLAAAPAPARAPAPAPAHNSG